VIASSEFTIVKWKAFNNTLPFEGKLDFEEKRGGMILNNIMMPAVASCTYTLTNPV
jgi:hypothetical protein